ncbi:MAG: hypothetical protein IJP44_09130 [Bacteroidales bacterium]|nr:hypothetical protein [Bacteroidales bacterium]
MSTLRRLSAIVFLLCMVGMALAQDVIVKTDNSTVLSKVLEITSTEIKYKKWDNQDGPTYSINRSEVSSINYQNGEVEKFYNNVSQPSNNYPVTIPAPDAGYMDVYGSSALKLNGRKLSDDEVRNLVDEHSYQTYLKGKREANLSGVSGCICIVGAIGSGVMFGLKKTIPAVLLTVVDVAGLIGWIAFDGSDEMKQVAAEYNRQHGHYYSIRFSPSLMNCETAQSPNNYGLGLTISMNF